MIEIHTERVYWEDLDADNIKLDLSDESVMV
jgi:hypothetical protein